MAKTTIHSDYIPDNAITGVKIAENSITAREIATNAITSLYVADDSVTADKLANSINTDIATGVTGNTTANAALPKAGGTMTGTLAMGGNVITSVATNNFEIDITGSLAGNIRANSDLYLLSQTGTLNLGAGGTNSQLKILTNGKVGIGTTAPSHGLTVSDIDGGDDADMRRITIKSETHGVNSGFRFDSESANGTARAGGYYFQPGNTDATTYLGLSADDTTIQVAITRAGNLGIGTTSPALQSAGTGLHVNGSSYSEIKFTNSSTGTAATDGTALVTNSLDFGINNREAGKLTFGTSNSTRMTIDSSGTVHVGVAGTAAGDVTGTLNIGNTGTYYMTQIKAINVTANPSILKTRMGFFTLSGTGETVSDSTEKMSILADTGNVGIGINTPAQPLSVMKNSSTSNTTPIAVFDTQVAGDYGIVEIDSGADNNYRPSTLRFKEGGNLKWEIGGTYQLADDSFGIRTTSSDYKMVIQANGNVGIGHTGPSAKLHLHHTAEEVLRIDSGDTGAIHFFDNTTRRGIIGYSNGSSIFSNVSAGDMAIRAESGKNIHLGISGTSYVTVNSSGVGIGETSPDTSLHIKKNQSSANSSIKLENAAGGNDSSFSIDWQLASSGTSAQIKAIRTNSAGAGDTDLVFSTSTNGASLAEQMRIDHYGKITAKNIDITASGGRVSSFVQDMFHIGGEKSARGRYGFSSSRTYVDGGSSNYQGYVFGQENYLAPVFIPYSPHQVYRISASIYQLTNGTGYSDSRHYVGLAGYDENFNFLSVDGIGTYQYILASNAALAAGNSLEVDVTLKGWQGSGLTDGNKMDEGTVYIRPLILFNYQRSGGTAVLTGFNIQPAATISDNDSNAGTNY